MLGPYSILDLLQGWDYRDYPVDVTITKNVTPLVEINKPGWLKSINIISTDAYGTIRITYKGPGGRELTANIYAEIAYLGGAFLPSPGGFVSLYYRPDPDSTAGLYYITGYDGSYGDPLPYMKPVVISGFLDDDSTESSASLAASISVIEIRDVDMFRKSLQAVKLFMDGRLDMKILDALVDAPNMRLPIKPIATTH